MSTAALIELEQHTAPQILNYDTLGAKNKTKQKKRSFRKGLFDVIDSLLKTLKCFNFKKPTNTKEDPKKESSGAIINSKVVPSLPKTKKNKFGFRVPSIMKNKFGFQLPEDNILFQELAKEKLIPKLNTPGADAKEDRYRKRLLRDLVTNKNKLNSEFAQKYTLGDLLGDGSFGFVFSATSTDGTEVAAKFIIRNKIDTSKWVVLDNGDKVPLEVSILRSLEHVNVVKFLGYFLDVDFVILITELHGTSWVITNPKLNPHKNLCMKLDKPLEPIGAAKSRPSCDLFECIDAHTMIPSYTCQKIFGQIVLACEYLNEKGLVHGDLKDENIVVDENYCIKMIDFGSAAFIPEDEEDYFRRYFPLTSYNGTPHFAAPEVVKRKPYKGPKSEVWTLGVLLYTIVFAENPFHSPRDILAFDGRLLTPRYVEQDLRGLLEGMLRIDPEKRYSLEQVI